MKRTLSCCLAAFALATASASLAGCKKSGEDTTKPDTAGGTDTGGGGGGDKAPGTPQEPDPPALADARKQFISGQYTQVVEAMRPLLDDLKTRQQLRASGLAAAWLALALAEDVVENAKEPADHAQAMADQTSDPEVKIAAKLAQGTFKLKTEDFAGAAADFEEAFNLQKDGPNAGLALLMYGNTKINMAFGGEDNSVITNPGEFDSANTSFVKAQRIAEKQPGSELLGGRALEGQAAVARYKGNNADACRLIGEANTIYAAKGAGQALLDDAVALADAANCAAGAPADPPPADPAPADKGGKGKAKGDKADKGAKTKAK